MDKKNVLITGVLGGVGLATAKVFKKAGWTVIGIDNNGTPSGDSIDQFITADISDPKALQNVYKLIEDKHGVLHAVVHNAAVQVSKPILETTLEDWDLVMNCNIRSVFVSTQLAIPLLKKAKGAAIINVSSVHAVATSKSMAAYAASKGALSVYTRAAALELISDKIRVNSVIPGAVDTPMLKAGFNRGLSKGSSVEEKVLDLGKKHPIGRIGMPEEIGEMILFLADGLRSSFIVGQEFVVDGGALCHLSTE